MNGTRFSTMLNPDDPAAMHLLIEHALGESQQYRVLSFEEIEELKRESEILSSRIDGIRRKLAIETKIRDAAYTLNHLDSTSGREIIGGAANRHQRNLHSKGSANSLTSQTNEDIAASVQRCEDLTQELWRTEQRYQDVEKLLLQHTAGVLQSTHKGYVEKGSSRSNEVNGHANGYGNLSLLDPDFDDQSFYQTLDSMLDSGEQKQQSAAFAQQNQSILDIQRRLWDLNCRLQDALTQVSSGKSMVPGPPALEPTENVDAATALSGQIEYMQSSFERMQSSHSEVAQNHNQNQRATEESLESLNNHLRTIVVEGAQDAKSQIPMPPQASGKGSDGQIAFLKGGLNALEQDVRKLRGNAQASHSRSRSHEEKVGRYESTFQNLWQKIVAEEEATRSRDGNAETVPREKFSIDAFATKVDLLNTHATSLHQQKDILSRQVQQQRELNSKSDTEKDAKMASVSQELEETKRSLEAANTEFQTQLMASQTNQARINQDLTQTKEHQASLEELASSKSAEAERTRTEMQDLEGELVRLQTELTVSRAELDGAYGTRAQRAAEVAQHPELMAELASLREELASTRGNHETTSTSNAELTQRVQTLQNELSETIGEYEVMTKSSIEFEKERENLESTIDGLRDKCEALETELSDEKVRWMGMKSPGVAGDRSSNEKGATSTSVLKNEFKKMMRETRGEHMKTLRVSLIVPVFWPDVLTLN